MQAADPRSVAPSIAKLSSAITYVSDPGRIVGTDSASNASSTALETKNARTTITVDRVWVGTPVELSERGPSGSPSR